MGSRTLSSLLLGAVLTRGHVLAEGHYADLSKDARVKEAYLGAGHA